MVDIDTTMLRKESEEKSTDCSFNLVPTQNQTRCAIAAKVSVLPLVLTIKKVEAKSVLETEKTKEILGREVVHFAPQREERQDTLANFVARLAVLLNDRDLETWLGLGRVNSVNETMDTTTGDGNVRLGGEL